MNLSEIIDAWITAGNPTLIQKELAEERAKICDDCPSKKVITKKIKIATICGECGCPIVKKIFTNTYDPCPLHKWDKVDEIYFPTKKNSKTII